MRLPDRASVLELLQSFAGNWRQLLAIHLLMALLVAIALTPLFGLLVRLVVGLSGQEALTDQDILFFAFQPIGFVGLLTIGAVFFFLMVAEHGALIVSCWQRAAGKPLSLWVIGRLVISRITAVLELAVRMMARTLVVVIPFAVAAGAVFWWLLTEYDINFYLQERPPEFWKAAALIGPLLLVMALLLARLFIGWTLALPVVLLNGRTAREAMAESQAAVAANRRGVIAWLAAWLALGLLMAATVAILVTTLTELSVPLAGESLARLGVALAFVLVLGFVLNFAVVFIDASLLSLVILRTFHEAGLSSGTPVVDASSGGMVELPPFSRPIVLGLLGIGVVIAGFAGWRLMERMEAEEGTVVTAHRGASAAAPENTLAAIELAVEEGAEWVEIDVQETVDGRIVVIHDRDLMKVASDSMVVGQSDKAALREVDIGSWFDPSFADQRVPTLEEALEAVRGRSRLNIELKYYGHEQRFEESVAEIVEAAGMVDDVVIMSLSYPGIQEMRRLRPDWTIGLLSSVALGDVTRLDADFFAVNARFASAAFVRRAQAAGKKVLVWTVNDPLTMCVMANRGVDSIITDEPRLARSVLTQRSELTNFERALLQVAAVVGHEIPISEP